MADEIAVLIPIVLFISTVWIIERIVHRRALHKERLKLIEKGGDSNLLNEQPKRGFMESNTLKYGLLAIGAAIGCLVGSILEQSAALATPEVGYFVGVFFFTGLALVVTHMISKKDAKS